MVVDALSECIVYTCTQTTHERPRKDCQQRDTLGYSIRGFRYSINKMSKARHIVILISMCSVFMFLKYVLYQLKTKTHQYTQTYVFGVQLKNLGYSLVRSLYHM